MWQNHNPNLFEQCPLRKEHKWCNPIRAQEHGRIDRVVSVRIARTEGDN